MTDASVDPSVDASVDASVEAHVDAAAALLGLSIEPYRDGVLRYFALAAAMNAIVDAVPLGVHDESGEVFVPVAPSSSPLP